MKSATSIKNVVQRDFSFLVKIFNVIIIEINFKSYENLFSSIR
jgi:hypothetical protein